MSYVFFHFSKTENFDISVIEHHDKDIPLNSHGFTVCHTVSLPFSRSHGGFFISYALTNFERIFSQTHSSLKKQTKAAHCNAAGERISRMINKNKTRSRSPLSLSWAQLFIVLVKIRTDNPFQWKPPSNLLKKVKKSTAEYNRQHSSK